MEKSTKERILEEALKLFAQSGYMGTSMSDIAKKLNITKAALYKHYTSKQEIFDSIVEKMNELDEMRVRSYEMPEGTFEKMASDYRKMPLEKIRIYSQAQFKHWTEDEFAADFRRMLTVEQYRNEEMKLLYQQYLARGPILYMEKLFGEMLEQSGKKGIDPKQIALDFYGPIYLMMNMYDKEHKEEVSALLEGHINRFSNEMREWL